MLSKMWYDWNGKASLKAIFLGFQKTMKASQNCRHYLVESSAIFSDELTLAQLIARSLFRKQRENAGKHSSRAALASLYFAQQ